MGRLLELTEIEVHMGFAALCVEATAKRVGCTYKEMYHRLKRVGLIQEFTDRFDPLHTQSVDYVAEDIQNALERLERKQKGGTEC